MKALAAKSELTKGEQSRAVILAATKRLIAERGFNAVTLQDVLNEAKVTKGRFFHHFTSKDDLYSELLRYSLNERSVLDFEQIISKAPSERAIDQLLYLLDRLVEWHEKGLPEEMRLCIFATFFFPLHSPEIMRINEILSANTKAAESLIHGCQQQGDLPASLDPKILALMFPSAAVGANLIGFLSDQNRLTPRTLVELRKLLAAFRSAAPVKSANGAAK